MRQCYAVGIVVLSLAFAATPAQAQATKVTGRVVGADGKAVAGVDVGFYWGADEDGKGMQAYGGSKTDAEGRFTLEANLYGRDSAIFAADAPRESGGFAEISAKEPGKVVEITLKPLVEVRGYFTCEEEGKPPGWTNVYLSLMPGMHRVFQCSSRAAKFALKVPPGEYDFNGYGSFTDYDGVSKKITVAAGKPLDLGAVDLKLTPIARHYGKEPPKWHVTDARGVSHGKDVALADFKGKWVVIEFWGFW
jgi:hypothetical protein